MLSRVKSFIETFWYISKTLVIFVVVSLILQISLVVIALWDYSNLEKVSGQVQTIEKQRHKRSIDVTVRLNSDSNIYYQLYTSRFYDKNIEGVKPSRDIYFYTTPKTYSKHMILFRRGPANFEYYPILNIDAKKSFLSVLSFHFYRKSILSVLIYISLAGSFFYLIPFIAISKWKNQLILLTIIAAYAWLFY